MTARSRGRVISSLAVAGWRLWVRLMLRMAQSSLPCLNPSRRRPRLTSQEWSASSSCLTLWKCHVAGPFGEEEVSGRKRGGVESKTSGDEGTVPARYTCAAATA